MGETLGIQGTKSVVHLAIMLVMTVEKAKADGKIDVSDIGLLFNLIPAIGPGVEGAKAFPKEMSDLSADEVAELSAFVMSELTIDDAKAKLVIEKALKLVGSSVELIAAIKS